MKINSAALLYFSPTKTTKKVIKSIANGFGIKYPRHIDLTYPKGRIDPNLDIKEDILIVGMPVYEERIPSFILPYLEQLQGHQQPVIAVAVYGNVGFGIVLKQFQNILPKKGFHLAAGAAFIAEHSFTHKNLRIAQGKPDTRDLDLAYDFGFRVNNVLNSHSDLENIKPPRFPGHLPPSAIVLPENSSRLFTELPELDPLRCNQCLACVNTCPIGAISPQNLKIDPEKCIRCFACVRTCPQNSREIKLKRSWVVQTFLSSAKRKIKEPYFSL